MPKRFLNSMRSETILVASLGGCRIAVQDVVGCQSSNLLLGVMGGNAAGKQPQKWSYFSVTSTGPHMLVVMRSCQERQG